MIDVAYELLITAEGGYILTQGGEVMWSGDDDDDFAESFGLEMAGDDEEADDVLDWLEDEGYLPPKVDVTIVDERD